MKGCIQKRIAFFTLVLIFVSKVSVASPPAAFTDTQIISGSSLSSPLAVAYEPESNNIWILEKGGSIKVYDGNTHSYLRTLTIANVQSPGEMGLLGIAFSPDYSSNRHVFFFVTRSNRNRVLRFSVSANGSLSNESDIYTGPSLGAQHHQGGTIRFAQDGTLLISMGDNGTAGTTNLARSLNDPRGSILRINADGSIPADNPFVNTGADAKEIWAYGLRNPFRFSIDSNTGSPIIGDVGEGRWEAIYLGESGADFGAPCLEGSHSWINCTPSASLKSPLFEYHHAGQTTVRGSAIAGGPVYRHNAFPSQYRNRYYFGDYSTGWIKSGSLSGNQLTDIQDFDNNTPGIVDLIVSPMGCLTWVSITGSGVHEVCNPNAQPNNRPHAIASANTQSGTAPLTVNFTGFTSTDPDGDSLSYSWDFGDGSISTLPNPSHTYTNGGVYTVVLTVDDQIGSDNSTDSADAISIVVGLQQPPEVEILLPLPATHYNGGDIINFSGSAVDPEDGQLGENSFSWTIEFHHADTPETHHTHPFLGPLTGSTGSFTIPVEHEGSPNVWYRIVMTVTDSGNPVGPDAAISETTSVEITPNVSDITLITKPAGFGQEIEYDGKAVTGSVTFGSVVNFPHHLSAPAYFQSALCLKFLNWSDGVVARNREITTPAENLTLEAIFSIDGVNCPDDASYEYTLPHNQWHQIGLPAIPGGNPTIAELFGDDIEPGHYGSDWAIFAFDPSIGSGGTYINPGADGILQPGVGYWIIQQSGNDAILDLPVGSSAVPLSVSTHCPSAQGCFEIPMVSDSGSVSWNLWGNPLDTEVHWADAKIINADGVCTSGCSPTEAGASQANIFHHQLWHYDPSSQTYQLIEAEDHHAHFQPWAGYWGATLENASNLRLIIPSP